MHARHQLYGLRLEQAHAVQLAHVKQHARVTRHISRSYEYSRVARHAAHMTSGGIMHRPAPGFALHDLGRSNPRVLAFGRQVARIHHFQRLINLAFDKFLQRRFADALHDFPQQKKIDIAITEDRAGRIPEFLFASLLNRRLLAVPAGSGLNVRTQAGGVRKKLPDRDRLFAVAREFRNISLGPFIEFHFSALHQQHDRRRAGKNLRE